MCSRSREREAGREGHPGKKKMGMTGAPWTELRPCWENKSACLSPNQAISSLILVGKLHTLPWTSRIQAWEGKFSSVCQLCGGGEMMAPGRGPPPTYTHPLPLERRFLACPDLPELAGRRGQRLKPYLWEWWSDSHFVYLSHRPFSDVTAAPEFVPLSNSWRALGDADIVGDTSPSPCDPCLCGEPEGARAGCVPSLAQVFGIFTGASPWPPGPLRCPIQCYWRLPRPPRRFHFHPLPCWPLPFLPKFSIPLGSAGRTLLTSIASLESPGCLLLRSSHRFLRLQRKTMARNAEIHSARLTDSEP